MAEGASPPVSTITEPATEFEYRKMSTNARKVWKKGNPPPPRRKPKSRSHSWHSSANPRPFVASISPSEDFPLEPANEEMLWHQARTLISNFERTEGDFIHQLQEILLSLKKLWENKLTDLEEQNEKLAKEMDEVEKSLTQSHLQEISASSPKETSKLLGDEIADLKRRLAEREKECAELRKELGKKQSRLRECMKEITEKELTEANLEGVERFLNLCATLKRKDYHHIDKDNVKRNIIMTLKRVRKLELNQLWNGWTL